MFNFLAKSEEVSSGVSVGGLNDSTASWAVLFGSGFVLVYRD